MKLVRGAALAAGLMVLGVAALACGGDDDDGDSDEATEPAATSTRAATSTPAGTSTPLAEDTAEPAAPTTAPAPAPTTAPAPPPTTAPAPPRIDTLTVSAGDFAFSPSALTVSGANDTAITVTNTGVTPHTMKVYRDQGYTDALAGAETQPITGGASGGFTLTSASIGGAAQLFFRCTIHPAQMVGTIAVQ
jgi:plastocyanin